MTHDRGFEMTLGEDAGGLRWFLNDAPLRCGQPLELLTDIGWLPVRFELQNRLPVFYFGLGSPRAGGMNGEGRIYADHKTARLRWAR